MKATKFLIALLLLAGSYSHAQTIRSVKTAYYYSPDVQSYYEVSNGLFIYQKNGKWLKSKALPARYKSYNFKTGTKVRLSETTAPYKKFSTHKVKYHKGYKAKKKYDGKRPGKSGSAPGHNKSHHSKGHDKK